MSQCHGLFSKHKLQVQANGEIYCPECERRWVAWNGIEVVPLGPYGGTWKGWGKYFSDRQTLPGQRPMCEYKKEGQGRLPLNEVAEVNVEYTIKRNRINDDDQIKQIRDLARKNPKEFLHQIYGGNYWD